MATAEKLVWRPKTAGTAGPTRGTDWEASFETPVSTVDPPRATVYSMVAPGPPVLARGVRSHSS